jgi:hypothetical protein
MGAYKKMYGILKTAAICWFLVISWQLKAEEQQWYLWAEATPFNAAVDCNIYHATPMTAVEAMNNFIRNTPSSSPTRVFVSGYQLVDRGDAGLVIEAVPTGTATLRFFRTKDACLVYAHTRGPG